MTHAQIAGLVFICLFPIGWIAGIAVAVAEQRTDRRSPTQESKP